VRRDRSPARVGALAAVGGLVSTAVFWHAGVGVAAQSAVLALAVAAVVAGTFAEREAEAPPLAGALAAALAITLLQLAPAPPALVRVVSPGAFELFETALGPLGLYPALRPLAVDPLATSRELGAIASMAAAFAAAVVIGRSRHAAHAIVRIVTLAGVAAVLLVLAGAALGRGPYLEPRFPFVNPNHLAAFLAVATWPALGFALREHGRSRALWLVAFALCGLGAFLTLSRAGIAAFLVGAGAFAALLSRRARPNEGTARTWPRVAVPAAVALVLVTASYVAVDRVVAELRTVATAGADARRAVWAGAVEVMLRHPSLGVGRGGFETVLPRFHLEADRYTYTHVENDWLQLAVDLGVPGALLVAGVIGWTWWSAARRRDLSRVDIGSLAGLAALGAHSFFDFPSAVPGVAIPAALVVGTLAARRGPPAGRSAWRAAAGVLLVVGVAGLGYHASTAARAGGVDPGASAAEAVERARAAAALSPADFLPHAAAGARLVELGRCPEAMPWLVRAMWLAPTIPEPHRYAARCLAAAGDKSQASTEYRLAFLLGDEGALEEGARFYPASEEILALAPDTPAGRSAAARLLARAGRHRDAGAAFTRAWEQFRDPDDLAAACESRAAAGELDEALRAAVELKEAEPNRARPYVLASHILERSGDAEGAVRALEQGRERVPGSSEVVFPLAELLIRHRRYSQAILVLDGSVQRTLAEMVRARLTKVRALRAQQRLPEAIAEARWARDIGPRLEEPHAVLAEVLADAGMYDAAAEALRAASAVAPDPSRYAARLAAFREAARARAQPPRAPQTPGPGPDGESR
jgi:tetratricopeptide (TPR) repeat protein/O-antigen ligase